MGDDFARNFRDHGEYSSTREGFLGPATFSSALAELRLCEWYWSDLSKSAAEKILRYKRIGSYLIRDSENDSHIFSLSYRGENSVYHIRIEYQHGTFSFGVRNHARVGIGRLCAPSLVSLIDMAKEEIRRGRPLSHRVCQFRVSGHSKQCRAQLADIVQMETAKFRISGNYPPMAFTKLYPRLHLVRFE
ncbi:putative SH2 domain protein [Trichinella spiralis]|uniref:putative SH2 domain protein n=1 Tax=Trichinella spiralis TaxID=6334 RepID=UPI0001EFD719|nr:putative SH2 domain protein [Trichinella spiralis]